MCLHSHRDPQTSDPGISVPGICSEEVILLPERALGGQKVTAGAGVGVRGLESTSMPNSGVRVMAGGVVQPPNATMSSLRHKMTTKARATTLEGNSGSQGTVECGHPRFNWLLKALAQTRGRGAGSAGGGGGAGIVGNALP